MIIWLCSHLHLALWISFALLPLPVFAHGATAGSQPLAPGHLQVRHLKPAEVVALFAREMYAEPAQARQIRSARAGNAESLLPAGVDALLRSDKGEVILVGSGSEVQSVAACIGIVDVPREATGAGRQKMVLTLHNSDPRRLRTVLLRLRGEGKVTFSGRRLGLEGSSAWLHAALREVIRAELKLTPTSSPMEP